MTWLKHIFSAVAGGSVLWRYAIGVLPIAAWLTFNLFAWKNNAVEEAIAVLKASQTEQLMQMKIENDNFWSGVINDQSDKHSAALIAMQQELANAKGKTIEVTQYVERRVPVPGPVQTIPAETCPDFADAVADWVERLGLFGSQEMDE